MMTDEQERVQREHQWEIAKLKRELRKAKENANCLRKYKFETIQMKSQIQTLINHKEQAPPKIANLFQFLRDNDYDAYVYLENMLLPISHQNRMEQVHKSIRVPSWWRREAVGSASDWLKRVRKPQPEYIYTYISTVFGKDKLINIHGVMLRSQSHAYNQDYKLEMYENKEELIKKLKVLGIEGKMSWTKARIYQKVMEIN